MSRAAPQPEKLQKNNVNKKKKLVEVRINIFPISLRVTCAGWNPSLFVSQWRAGTVRVCAFPCTLLSPKGNPSRSSTLAQEKPSVGFGMMEFALWLWNFPFSPNNLFGFPHNRQNQEYFVTYVDHLQHLSVANWDCSQWAVIVFGAVIKLGLRAPRQLYQQSINHAGFLEEISLATAHCKLQLHLWLMS